MSEIVEHFLVKKMEKIMLQSLKTKPNNKKEKERIIKNGGLVYRNRKA